MVGTPILIGSDTNQELDGRCVSSTDGFCSIVTFKDGELGEVYDETKNSSSEEGEKKENEAGNKKVEEDAPKKEVKEASFIAIKKKPSSATAKKSEEAAMDTS